MWTLDTGISSESYIRSKDKQKCLKASSIWDKDFKYYAQGDSNSTNIRI